MKKLSTVLVFLSLIGCSSVPPLINISPEESDSYKNFALPYEAKQDEAVAYFVHLHEGGVLTPKKEQSYKFVTSISIEENGSRTFLPGEYVVFKIKPGNHRIEADRACGRISKDPLPPVGTVIMPSSPGWEKRTGPAYGARITRDSSKFEFEAGKTYIFRFSSSCYMSPSQGGLVFSAGSTNIQNPDAKYLVFKTKKAN